MNDAAKISPEYVALVSLVTRQTMAGMEITVSQDSTGALDPSDVQIFVADIGGSKYVWVTPPHNVHINATHGLALSLVVSTQSRDYTRPYQATYI